MLCFDLHAYNIAFLGYSLGKFGIFTWKYFWKAPTAEYCQSRRWRTKNGILDLVLHKYWEWIVNFIWLILTFCKTSYPLQICSCLQKILPCLLCHVDHHLVNDRRHRRTGCHSLPRFGLNPIGWKTCNQIYSCASKQPTRYTEHFNDTGWFFLLVRPIFSTKMKNDGQPIRDSVPWNSRCAKDPVQKIPKDFWYWKLGGPVKKHPVHCTDGLDEGYHSILHTCIHAKKSNWSAGLHNSFHPTIRDGSTWSKFGARGEHGDVFLFSNLGALWFSENLIRYSLHVCLREVKNNLFSFKHSYLRHFSWRF